MGNSKSSIPTFSGDTFVVYPSVTDSAVGILYIYYFYQINFHDLSFFVFEIFVLDLSDLTTKYENLNDFVPRALLENGESVTVAANGCFG